MRDALRNLASLPHRPGCQHQLHVIRRCHRRRLHPCQYQYAAKLLAHRSYYFHLPAGMLVRRAMLHVDDAHHPVACYDGRRKKGIVSVFRQIRRNI